MPTDDLPLSKGGEARRAGLPVPPTTTPWTMPQLPSAQSVALDSWAGIWERAIAAAPPGQVVGSPVAAGTVVEFRRGAVLDREMVSQNADGHLGFPDPPPEEVVATGTIGTQTFEGDRVADLAVTKIAAPEPRRPFRRPPATIPDPPTVS